MNNVVETLKKMHAVQAIEKKDISLQDLVNQEGKQGVLDIEIKGFASKYVSKYDNENNNGYHTMIYMKDGRKTGAFSNALHEFANFFYEKAGMDSFEKFNKITFDGGIKVRITKVKLDGNKSTYNFEILDGEINGVERNDGLGAIKNILPESVEVKALNSANEEVAASK